MCGDAPPREARPISRKEAYDIARDLHLPRDIGVNIFDALDPRGAVPLAEFVMRAIMIRDGLRFLRGTKQPNIAGNNGLLIRYCIHDDRHATRFQPEPIALAHDVMAHSAMSGSTRRNMEALAKQLGLAFVSFCSCGDGVVAAREEGEAEFYKWIELTGLERAHDAADRAGMPIHGVNEDIRTIEDLPTTADISLYEVQVYGEFWQICQTYAEQPARISA